jgi:radical SAM protein with 4Fe4S-binding SPASM domain
MGLLEHMAIPNSVGSRIDLMHWSLQFRKIIVVRDDDPRPFDRAAFARMKRIVPMFLAGRRREAPTASAVPEEIAFKLTNQCNLRCRHCYQWSEFGHHRDLGRDEQRQHLPIRHVATVLEATRDHRSNLYVWGGEPLMYRYWHEFIDLLAQDRRWTSICTNGVFIERRLESLLRVSSRLELDVAVDGLADEHDALRGEGSFARTLRGIESVLDHRRSGRYHGEISVNCVVSDALVPRLESTVRFWQGMGIDTLYLALPWFLSPTARAAMDRHVEDHSPWPVDDSRCGRPSWHAYAYQTDPRFAQRLIQQLRTINRKTWKLKIRYNPAVDEDQLEDFLEGSGRPVGGRSRCLAILSRMDVLPNGDVVSCKFYPESVMGNLDQQSVAEIWHGPRFGRLREVLHRRGLMPACASCSLLYSRGA